MASQYPLKVSSGQYVKDQDDLGHLRRALAIATEALDRLQGVCTLHGACPYDDCGGRIAREALAAIAREVGP